MIDLKNVLPGPGDTIDQKVDRRVEHEKEVRHRDGAHDPRRRKPSNAPTFAVDNAVDNGKVVNVQNDAKKVAADKNDDDTK